MCFFDSTEKKDFDRVVMVSLAHTGARLMGLVTREDFGGLPEGIGSQKTVALYTHELSDRRLHRYRAQVQS